MCMQLAFHINSTVVFNQKALKNQSKTVEVLDFDQSTFNTVVSLQNASKL